MTIHEKMFNVMTDVDKIIKDLDVKFKEVKYKGISHDQVTEMIRKQLLKQKLLSIVRIISHTQDGNRTEVDIEVEFVDIEAPDSSIKVRGFGYGIDTQDKGPGKAISYAVKYVYLKTFCLLTGDDPERDDINYQPPEARVAQPAANGLAAKKARLRSFVQAIGGWDTFCVAAKDKLDVNSTHNWTEEEFDTAIAICKSIEAKK